MRTTVVSALLLLMMAAPARAQNPDDLLIHVGAYVSSANGGEKNEGIHHSMALTMGKAFVGRWSMWGCGIFQLSARDAAFPDEATTGWRVEITPLRVVDRAVTFRLRWVRALDRGRESSFTPTAPPQEDVELTLRSGEERTIDRVLIPKGAQTRNHGACQHSAGSLRVSVDSDPWADMDHRLIAADLWLVERVAGGGERSQPLSIRGLPNRPIAFYFDSIADGANSLDIFGEVVPTLQKDGLDITLSGTQPMGPAGAGIAHGWVADAVARVGDSREAQEIVEVALPRLGRMGGPFGDRQFSIRIRARQVR